MSGPTTRTVQRAGGCVDVSQQCMYDEATTYREGNSNGLVAVEDSASAQVQRLGTALGKAQH